MPRKKRTKPGRRDPGGASISKPTEMGGASMSKLGERGGGRIEVRVDKAVDLVHGAAAIGAINRPGGFYSRFTKDRMKILFLSANPVGTDPLKLLRECNNIREKIKAARYANQFDFEQWHEALLSKLQGYLLDANPQIVHFSGHGAVDGTLVFEDYTGQPERTRLQAIARLFRILNDRKKVSGVKKVRCVVLSACYSLRQARALAKHVDCVIGMKNAVYDDAARVFAESFYQALGEGESVETAFELGKNQVELLSIPGQDIPKLEVRDGVDPRGVFLASQKPSRGQPA